MSIFLIAASLNSRDPTPTWPCLAATLGVTGAFEALLFGDVDALLPAVAAAEAVALLLELPVLVLD